MNDFVKGISTIGQLSPSPYPYKDYPSQSSAWKGVADSFRQAGNDLRYAIRECTNAKPENEQTP